MRIAIVGTGISGMVVAYLLSQSHDLVVYEADDHIGGHTHTHDVEVEGRTFAVDTGFIVFNQITYPHFVKLLKRLGVRWKPSTMSFSVKCEQTGLEYSPSSINALFAQRRNLFRPRFYRMLWDLFRFRRESLELLDQEDYEETLGAYLERKSYDPLFIEKFIIPMGAAIWSADPSQFRLFPAKYFVEFFNNHGFLKVRNQPQWLVIEGGSKRYVERLTEPYLDRVRLNCPVKSIHREKECVEVKTRDGHCERFDHAVIATHSDQALALLSDPSDAEQVILSAMPYQGNATVLHTDASLLPRNRICWASWNYHIPKETLGRAAVTYNMNMLQGLLDPVTFCVTLNRPTLMDPAKVLRRMTYFHPVYTAKGLAAQKRHHEISGVNRTHFCGAHWGYGFHEDGVNSALAVCRDFGVRF